MYLCGVVPRCFLMSRCRWAMASPNAANLAAKLLTVNPELSTTEVISLIDRGADELDEGEGLKLLNPAESMALLLAEQQASK